MFKHVARELRENPYDVALAAAGATQGVYRYYLRDQLTAKRAWGGLAGLLVVYELSCPPGQTLSEGADRALEAHKWLTLGAIGVTALHLSNAIPPKLDPFHRTMELIKR